MNEDGYIDAYEIVSFNKIKIRGVTIEKIEEIVKNNQDIIAEYALADNRFILEIDIGKVLGTGLLL